MVLLAESKKGVGMIMMQTMGQQALISMVSHIVFIIITWRLLQVIKMDALIRKGRIFEARVLFLFLTIAIGTLVSQFFLDFLSWSQQLIFLF